MPDPCPIDQLVAALLTALGEGDAGEGLAVARALAAYLEVVVQLTAVGPSS